MPDISNIQNDSCLSNSFTKEHEAIPKKERNQFTFKIQLSNVVASVNFHRSLDLALIDQKFRDVRSRVRFPGLITSLTHPKATILIFQSGKLVITGFTIPDDVSRIIEKIQNKFESIGIQFPQKPTFKIENIVVRGDFKRRLNLDLVSMSLDRCIYEPELFPGVIYRMDHPKQSILLFSTGKFIITGTCFVDDIKKGAKKLAWTLKKQHLFDRSQHSPDPISLSFSDLKI